MFCLNLLKFLVARPTPFFFLHLHMHAIYCVGVHECEVCYYYDVCTTTIDDSDTVPRQKLLEESVCAL